MRHILSFYIMSENYLKTTFLHIKRRIHMKNMLKSSSASLKKKIYTYFKKMYIIIIYDAPFGLCYKITFLFDEIIIECYAVACDGVFFLIRCYYILLYLTGFHVIYLKCNSKKFYQNLFILFSISNLTFRI
jgi:hypothetical protein